MQKKVEKKESPPLLEKNKSLAVEKTYDPHIPNTAWN